jgi:hypothetical protein
MANIEDYFEQNLSQNIRILFLSACLLFEVQYVSLQYYGIQEWKARLLRSGSFTIWKQTAIGFISSMANHVEDLENIQIFYSAITSEINNSKQLKKIKALGVEQLAISKH